MFEKYVKKKIKKDNSFINYYNEDTDLSPYFDDKYVPIDDLNYEIHIQFYTKKTLKL